ncbi:MAG: zinc ribbon domain-containing protein YjdM [Fuerstiella sp.]|nr:zinc ribbon domain-containing protein YjdM [Fuerstiella sp.]
MPDVPDCPTCASEFTYRDGLLFVCPSCAHEWTATDDDASDASESDSTVVRDANGNILQTGDSVIVIKDLKVKGASTVVKGGTKVRKIRLVDGDHDVDCKIDGIVGMQLKSQFAKKA